MGTRLSYEPNGLSFRTFFIGFLIHVTYFLKFRLRHLYCIQADSLLRCRDGLWPRLAFLCSLRLRLDARAATRGPHPSLSQYGARESAQINFSNCFLQEEKDQIVSCMKKTRCLNVR